jgi:hypothetical protein
MPIVLDMLSYTRPVLSLVFAYIKTCWSAFSVFVMLMVLVMLSYARPVLSTWFKYPELLLLFLLLFLISTAI